MPKSTLLHFEININIAVNVCTTASVCITWVQTLLSPLRKKVTDKSPNGALTHKRAAEIQVVLWFFFSVTLVSIKYLGLYRYPNWLSKVIHLWHNHLYYYKHIVSHSIGDEEWTGHCPPCQRISTTLPITLISSYDMAIRLLHLDLHPHVILCVVV